MFPLRHPAPAPPFAFAAGAVSSAIGPAKADAPNRPPVRAIERARALRLSNGFTIVEVMMASVIRVVGFIGMISAITVGSEMLATARRHGAMTMIHAENSDCIAWLTEQLLDAGLTAPKYHAASRPMAVEREATHRAIALAELVDTPILIVHVSGREAVEQIHWARGRGLPIHAETCPQYLFLSAEDLGIWNDEQVEPLRRITRFIESQGAVAGVQLAHAGRKASTWAPWLGKHGSVPISEGGWTPVAPSAIGCGGASMPGCNGASSLSLP